MATIAITQATGYAILSTPEVIYHRHLKVLVLLLVATCELHMKGRHVKCPAEIQARTGHGLGRLPAPCWAGAG